jgi:hypothetical protein
MPTFKLMRLFSALVTVETTWTRALSAPGYRIFRLAAQPRSLSQTGALVSDWDQAVQAATSCARPQSIVSGCSPTPSFGAVTKKPNADKAQTAAADF